MLIYIKWLSRNNGENFVARARARNRARPALLGSPKLLLIDEPTEGLAPSIVALLKTVFGELSKNAPLIIVEQNLEMLGSGARNARV